MPWAAFHTFRHTCLSLLIADGRTIVQVSRWLGHHSPTFTLKLYAHLTAGDAIPLPSGWPGHAAAIASRPLRG